jgi:serine protease AprX
MITLSAPVTSRNNGARVGISEPLRWFFRRRLNVRAVRTACVAPHERPRARRRFGTTLAILLFVASPVLAAKPIGRAVELLVLMRDTAALTTQLHALRTTAGSVHALRGAVNAARRAAFETGASAAQAEIVGALPPEDRGTATLEPLPAFDAFLLRVPAAAAERVYRGLRRAAQSSASGLAWVSRAEDATDAGGAAESAVGTASAEHVGAPTPAEVEAEPSAPVVIGIIDTGADAEHPLLRHALGRVYFEPGTPGSRRDGHFLRSHGTAMLGIYSQFVEGMVLEMDGAPQPWLAAAQPFALRATIVARAGPERPSGRAQFARALHWMVAPDAARPVPDVLNYSQGNGALCTATRPADCRRLPWYGVTRVLDRAIDELGIVVVKSAGNRGYGAATTMTVPGDTYNGITVGNMQSSDRVACAPSPERARHAIYRTSSVAPPRDGGPRLLDLVAPGVRVATAGVDPAYCNRRCREGVGLDCGFCPRLGQPTARAGDFRKLNTGSSPAAAMVGALAAEFIALGEHDPMRIKAILINSADAWTSGGEPPPRTPCANMSEGLAHHAYPSGAHYDRSYGWGYLNPAQARTERPYALRAELSPAGAQCYTAELQPWDKVTLVWQRRVGRCETCGGAGWYRLSPLELTLYDARGRRRLDRDLHADPRDNVRQVSNGRGARSRPRARPVIVRVATAAMQLDGLPAQGEPYALASRRPLTPLARCPRPVVAHARSAPLVMAASRSAGS